jgi:hypothetical protein
MILSEKTQRKSQETSAQAITKARGRKVERTEKKSKVLMLLN